jgi:hypothetical protein
MTSEMQSVIVRELKEIGKFLLGFSPWIVFLFLPSDGWEPLRRAVVICLVVTTLISLKDLRKGFILAWGTWLFFLFSTVSFYGFNWYWLAKHMAVIANVFLAGIVWFTILIGKPFTLQYARAELPKERWNDEGLVSSCRSIALFWGALLLVPTFLNALRLYYPSLLPEYFYFDVTLICIAVGTAYTTYFKHKKRKEREVGITNVSL